MKKEKILNDVPLSEYEKRLAEFFKKDARNANHYFFNISYKLTHDAAYESKIKFQLFYLNLLSEKNQAEKKINTLLKQYLAEFIQSSHGDEEYDALVLHICGEVLKICHNLINKLNNTNKSYWDIADLYHTAISFLLNQKSIDPACSLLIAKADLYRNKLSDSKSAVLCLNKILQIKYHQHLLDDTYCQNYNLIIESLKKLQENTNNDEDKDVYSKLISLLNKCEKEKTYVGTEFVSLAMDIQKKNKPMLSKQLYYIGQIISLRHEKLHNIEDNTDYSFNFGAVLSFWIKELRNKSDLFLAIQKDDLEQVEQLITAGISFEDINSEGLTPLTYAVKLGHLKIVQSLIKFGAKVNEIVITDDKIINAPIYFAVKSKNIEMAKFLLEEKADIRIFNTENHSLLYIATQNKDKNMVQLLKHFRAEPLNKSETEQLKKDPIYLQGSPIEDLNKLLVSFNNGSQKNKIFCVHPVTGEVMAYKKFADEIREKDPERPVWGINSPAYFNIKNLPTTIEGIASLYISAIKQKQKQGPYILCGWSFGGLVAYEIAYQLAKINEPVILLGLFDTYSPQILQTMEQKKFAKYLLNVITSLRHLFKEPLIQLDEKYLAQFPNEKQIDVAIDYLEKHQGPKTASGNNSNVNKMIQLIRVNLHAALKYQPIQDDCTPFVTCFNTAESIQECGCADLGWSSQTMGKVIVNKLNCTHNEILFNKDTVTKLADYILGHYQVLESDDALMEIKTNLNKMKPYYPNLSQVLSTNDVKRISVFAQQLHKGLFKRPMDVDSYFSDNNNKHEDNNHTI